MTDRHVFQATIISVMCGICFWIGMGHQASVDGSRIKQLEEQVRYQKLLLGQDCIRPGSIKKLKFDMGRRK